MITRRTTRLLPRSGVVPAAARTALRQRPLPGTVRRCGPAVFSCSFVVRLGDERPANVVKFRPRFSRPREDDDAAGEVCTLGTVSVTPRYGPGEASLLVLTCARVVGDQGKDDPPGRNPAYPVFSACADFPELRENFVKLISQSPGIDAVPGSNLLDTLEAIEQVGREYDGCRNKRLPDEPGGRDDGGNEAPERPMLFLDVAGDFIAVSLIRGIPDLEVPVRLQQECSTCSIRAHACVRWTRSWSRCSTT